jgi:hypothetical protein
VRPGGTVLIAAGSDASPPPGAALVRLGDIGDVDSPGALFMMSRDG